MINVKFNNGIEMPILGLGLYKITDKKEVENAVKWAIEAGYRKFDTAQFYDNEKELGEAIRKTAVKREELFITTKIWNTKQGYNSTRKSFEESLEKLNMDYVDLVLIHWPGQKKERYLDTLPGEVVYFLRGSENYFFKIKHNLDITYFDLPNYGNYGYNGVDKLIRRIKNVKNSYFVIDISAYDSTSPTQQYIGEAVEYIMERGVKIKEIGYYQVYEMR